LDFRVTSGGGRLFDCPIMNAQKFLLILALGFSDCGPGLLAAPAKPNIVLIYADDVGYGDVGAYGAKAVETPHIDRLAREGLRFTDAHSPSATCTPSRYAMLTGEYAWRKKGTGVLPGDAALVIEPNRQTMASILKAAGYRTGVVGKWHLGLGEGKLDWNGEIRPGPLELGFDYAFLMPATGDRVPTVYVENHRVVGLDPKDPIEVSFSGPFAGEPTGKSNPELLKLKPSHGHDMAVVNGISRIGHMRGGKAALWVDEDMADVFVSKAKSFMDAPGEGPFFLYFSTHDIHVPRTPHPRFAGETAMGARGDAMAQLDWCVGELLKRLDERNLAENTLVIFTSDNGPVVDDGYQDGAVSKLGGHKPAGPWRGGKYSLFEGGTRVPMIARWPARVKPGVSEALMCQVDFSAMLASLTGGRFDGATARDSQDHLAALLDGSKPGRRELVHHANGQALRLGNWKWIEKRAGQAVNRPTQTELGNSPADQLYDLANDPGEISNLAEAMPEKVAEMRAALSAIRGW